MFEHYFSNAVNAPQDIFGKINLTSPSTAQITFKFRPPVSRPELIKSFTFKLSESEESFELKVVDKTVRFSLKKCLVSKNCSKISWIA